MYQAATPAGGTGWHPGHSHPGHAHPGHSTVLEDSPAPHGVIYGLRGSMTYRLAVQVYQRHYDRGDGRCVQCGLPAPCAPRSHAAAVVRAAGDDPGRHDPQQFTRPNRYANSAPTDRWDHRAWPADHL